MSCDQNQFVHAYHDGALPAPQRAAIESHMASCAECAVLLNELRGLSRLFSTARPAEISSDAMRRLRNVRYVLPDRGVLKIAGWLTAAAAAVLLAALPLWRQPAASTNTNNAADVAIDAAVTPPVEADSAGHNDLVALADWMSDDLSTGERH